MPLYVFVDSDHIGNDAALGSTKSGKPRHKLDRGEIWNDRVLADLLQAALAP